MNQLSFLAEGKEDGQNGFIPVTTCLANEIYQVSHYVALSLLHVLNWLFYMRPLLTGRLPKRMDIRVFVSLTSRLAQF